MVGISSDSTQPLGFVHGFDVVEVVFTQPLGSVHVGVAVTQPLWSVHEFEFAVVDIQNGNCQFDKKIYFVLKFPSHL